MKIYTIEEDNYTELTEWVNKVLTCGKKLLEKLGDESVVHTGFRNRGKYYEEDYDDDYEWNVKKVRSGRYNY